MGNIKIFVYGAVGIMLVVGGLMIQSLRQENERLSNNQEAMFANEKIAANEKRQLELTVGELKGIISQDSTLKEALEKDIKVKANQIQHLSKIASKSRIEIKTELRDTVIYKTDTLWLTRSFNWSNDWYKANGVVSIHPTKQDSIQQVVTGVDSIYYMTVNEKYSKWFLPRWFEKPTPVTKIWNANPYQEIRVQRSINVKK